ncbi:hypothetical protein ITQ84_07225 [Pediococcus pentosaceus]|uniref:hypothetical protein n=1 Tax=Pediococcus pentosaceus TaxID=1255 RepID=UPI0013302B5A|nr:hypothetical protein [Pediococcus pentosaceus]KAF0505860.1 hypothetical protein GBP24_07705 [Pediococcus pentosaceus]MBF7140168.1 hypothetical protein [Pediococcus pentosaceus]MCM6819730.1 hypothetical protein [Pediococcus pentosaceus]
MNNLQITTITVSNNDDLGNGTTKRKIGYTGSFSDGTHTEGFILLSEEDFLKTNFFDLKNTIRNKLIENLGGEISGK